jgi:hypothetical protein
MNFIEIKPARSRSSLEISDKVRISFPTLKDKSKHTMLMYLGKDVAGQIGIHGGDKIKFYVDQTNPRIWFIKKSNDDSGYKVLDIKSKKGKGSSTLRIQMTWQLQLFKPSADEVPVQ